MEQVLSIIDLIEDLTEQVDAMIKLAETSERLENPDLADQIYQQTIDVCFDIEDGTDQAMGLSKIAKSLMLYSKDLGLIEQLRNQSLELGLSLDEGTDREYLLSRLVSNFNDGAAAQTAESCFQISLKIVAEVDDQDYQRDILISIIKNAERINQPSQPVEELLEQTIKLATGLENEIYRDDLLAQISLLYTKCGTKNGNEKWLTRSLTLAKGLQNEGLKSRSVMALGREVHIGQNIDQGLSYLEEGIGLLDNIQDIGHKTTTFLRVLKDFQDCSVLEVLDSVLSASPTLIQSLDLSKVDFHYEKGLVDETLPVAMQVSKRLKLTNIFETLFDQFIDLGSLEEVLDTGYAQYLESEEGMVGEGSKAMKKSYSLLVGVTKASIKPVEGWPTDPSIYADKLLEQYVRPNNSENSLNYNGLVHPMLDGRLTETALKVYEKQTLELNSEDKREIGQYLTVGLGQRLAGAEAIEALQRNIVHLPSHYQLSHDWVNAMRVANIKAGKFEYFDAINSICPQLEWVSEEAAETETDVATVEGQIHPYRFQSDSLMSSLHQAYIQIKLETLWELVEEGHLSEEVFQQKREALLLATEENDPTKLSLN